MAAMPTPDKGGNMITTERRVLVIANETIAGDALHAAIRRSAGDGRTAVLVVAPALNSRLRHWASDEDDARLAAGLRLSTALDRLSQAGVDATGYVGDADPLQAIADGLAFFAADEIIIATHPEERSNWLAHDLVMRACAQTGLPVLHVVVAEVEEPATLVLHAA
jgi:hypothetical protein